MERCTACGKMAFVSDKIGEATLCKFCSLKIQMPMWKKKLFTSVNEIEMQRSKAINLARKNNFPENVIAQLNDYFISKESNGFITAITSMTEQTLKVYENYCIIDTDSRFDVDEMSEEYAELMKSTKPSQGFFDKPGREEAIAKGLLAGHFVKTGIGVAATAVMDEAKKEISPLKEPFSIHFGEDKIFYSDCAGIDFMNIGPNGYGYIKFYMNYRVNELDDKIFFFYEDDDDMKDRINSVYNILVGCLDAEKVTKEDEKDDSKSQERDSFEVIRKYKELLDEGIITEEEFNLKKKELLNL